jgi:DNA-binding beta-propeller fold protein YncE
MAQTGGGKYTYEVIQNFPKLPAGQSFGVISRVATDSKDRIYVFQRKDPPVVVFDRDGNYLNSWGSGSIAQAHGLKIVNDKVYITDRPDSVAMVFTLDGKPLRVLGNRGVHSDTGCEGSPFLAKRPGGPFNHPTEMMPHPNGDLYVTDGYRNCRVHQFRPDGQLVKSWGTPGSKEGEFHLPHSIAIDPDGSRLYIADRSNRRIQIFTPDGKFIGMWTGMGGPNDITLGKDGIFYIAEQEADGKPPYICLRDHDGQVLARLECPRHIHGVGVDSRGDIYAGLTVDQNVDKFVRKN